MQDIVICLVRNDQISCESVNEVIVRIIADVFALEENDIWADDVHVEQIAKLWTSQKYRVNNLSRRHVRSWNVIAKFEVSSFKDRIRTFKIRIKSISSAKYDLRTHRHCIYFDSIWVDSKSLFFIKTWKWIAPPQHRDLFSVKYQKNFSRFELKSIFGTLWLREHLVVY